MRLRAPVVLALAALVLPCDLALTACRSPTDITVIVTTDFGCSDLHHTTVSIGTLGDAFEALPATSTSTTCSGDGYAGRVVVIPSGSVDALVGIKVVGGFGTKNAEDCAPKAGSNPPDYGRGCIVARRALKYVSHKPLTVPIVLRASCDGVPCGATETCVNGACAPATLGDPNACTGDGCDECKLVDGGCAPPPVYNDMTDKKNWSVFDFDAALRGQDYEGCAFDGTFMYFARSGSGAQDARQARFDTRASFVDAASWSAFDTTTANPSARGYAGAVFDGRYVYYSPRAQGVTPHGTVARYDTRASFVATTSWSTFDATSIDARAKGFFGVTFDGRYVYFVPFDDVDDGAGGGNGKVTRYDTRASFADAASWSIFDTTTINAAARLFIGAVFDGRYVYFSPAHSPGKIVARYDTTADFGASGSWSTFDTVTTMPGRSDFRTAAFDGRYVYLLPLSATPDGRVLRYDTRASFVAAASWSTFDARTVHPWARNFFGAAFDGRFMYFVPNGFDVANGNNAILTRYDTWAVFGDASSWSTFDLTSLDRGASQIVGAGFDGRYVYLIPSGGSLFLRFDAKSPPSMPRGYSGSFF